MTLRTPLPAAVARVVTLAMLAAWLGAASVARADFRGRVVSVADGDTVTVLVERTQVRVRLSGIDAPERGQPFGDVSRRSLASLVASRVVEVREHGRDGFGRVLGTVVADGVDANAEQVERGYAWVFRRFSHDPRLLALEARARESRRGLWRDPDPVPPWQWRERHRANAPPLPVASEPR